MKKSCPHLRRGGRYPDWNPDDRKRPRFPECHAGGSAGGGSLLNAVDYRAGERTFQLLTQAVGRAGRGEKPGMAVIQTYHPEHYSIQTAAEQDYGTFYEKEMDYRRLMGYPPAAELLAIHGAGEDEAHLTQAMEYIRRYLIRIRGNREVQIIGPASEAVSKINDLYRMAVYVRAPQEEVLAELRENWSGISRLTKASVPFIYSLTSAESISFFILFTHRLFIIEEQKKGKELWQSEKSES